MNPQTIGSILLIVVMIGVFYFLMIRPQKKRDREQNEMRDSLRVGDEITTIGGVVGKVVSVREETFVLETTKDKTHIRFLRAAVRTIDVRAEDSVDPTKQESTEKADKNGKGKKNKKKPAIEPAATVDTPAVATEVATVEAVSENAAVTGDNAAVDTEVATVDAVSESDTVSPEGKKS